MSAERLFELSYLQDRCSRGELRELIREIRARIAEAPDIRPALELLLQALLIYRDSLESNPRHLFPCLYNLFFWHDSPRAGESRAALEGDELLSRRKSDGVLYRPAQRWEAQKRQAAAKSGSESTIAPWLRSLRTLDPPLDSPYVTFLR